MSMLTSFGADASESCADGCCDGFASKFVHAVETNNTSSTGYVLFNTESPTSSDARRAWFLSEAKGNAAANPGGVAVSRFDTRKINTVLMIVVFSVDFDFYGFLSISINLADNSDYFSYS